MFPEIVYNHPTKPHNFVPEMKTGESLDVVFIKYIEINKMM